LPELHGASQATLDPPHLYLLDKISIIASHEIRLLEYITTGRNKAAHRYKLRRYVQLQSSGFFASPHAFIYTTNSYVIVVNSHFLRETLKFKRFQLQLPNLTTMQLNPNTAILKVMSLLRHFPCNQSTNYVDSDHTQYSDETALNAKLTTNL